MQVFRDQRFLNDRGAGPTGGGADSDAQQQQAVTVGGKRGRGNNIATLSKFKQQLVGVEGIRRFAAIVGRNPILIEPSAASAAAAVDPLNPLDDTHTRASYQHRDKLKALIGCYYEWNHASFSKIPLRDTMTLLQRANKEAIGSVYEYEREYRMAKDPEFAALERRRQQQVQLQQEHGDDEGGGGNVPQQRQGVDPMYDAFPSQRTTQQQTDNNTNKTGDAAEEDYEEMLARETMVQEQLERDLALEEELLQGMDPIDDSNNNNNNNNNNNGGGGVGLDMYIPAYGDEEEELVVLDEGDNVAEQKPQPQQQEEGANTNDDDERSAVVSTLNVGSTMLASTQLALGPSCDAATEEKEE